MLSQSIKDEIRNSLWGCVEIPLYLKRGAMRFQASIASFKRSLIVPILLIPVFIATVPTANIYAEKSLLWLVTLYLLQIFISIFVFMAAVYFFKNKQVTNEQYLRCITGYNWLALSTYVVNIPLIILGHLGVHPWNDVFAMMMLMSLYCASYLAYMIIHTLKTNIFVGVAFAVLDLLLGEVIRNLTTYFMMHNF